jgi:hypothetical protein
VENYVLVGPWTLRLPELGLKAQVNLDAQHRVGLVDRASAGRMPKNAEDANEADEQHERTEHTGVAFAAPTATPPLFEPTHGADVRVGDDEPHPLPGGQGTCLTSSKTCAGWSI